MARSSLSTRTRTSRRRSASSSMKGATRSNRSRPPRLHERAAQVRRHRLADPRPRSASHTPARGANPARAPAPPCAPARDLAARSLIAETSRRPARPRGSDGPVRPADLDALLALAACARDFGFARPVISAEQTSVRIKQGWHPLLRLVVSQAVPNDFSLGEGGGRLVLLTGPNASGKTVYLRTAAIIVFLAQIGSFVPGARSRVKTPARMREWRSRETVCGAQPRALSSVYPTRSTRA